MSEDTVQLLAAAAIAICQIYVAEPWKFHVFARFWDLFARITGRIANVLGWMSLEARHNYFIAITEAA